MMPKNFDILGQQIRIEQHGTEVHVIYVGETIADADRIFRACVESTEDFVDGDPSPGTAGVPWLGG